MVGEGVGKSYWTSRIHKVFGLLLKNTCSIVPELWRVLKKKEEGYGMGIGFPK